MFFFIISIPSLSTPRGEVNLVSEPQNVQVEIKELDKGLAEG